ncbi:hypothetical protein J4E81_006715 [Alternaria sp. BMP 2799]|nr:hypothetical protein J4E81_006715 [Alternaria sp. BMP 2799]
MRFSNSLVSLAAVVPVALASIPYSQYILAPKSRTLHPVSVHSTNGSVTHPESLTGANGSSVFTGEAATAYDFGINIAGLVTVTIGSVNSSSSEYIGVTFSESSLWVSNRSSDATADAGKDETLWFHVNGTGRYTAPREKVRDELLNRVWYAGAYTNQICTIEPDTGNALVHLREEGFSSEDDQSPVNVTWYNNYTITSGKSALVDGAKRDRLVWAGDMAIAVPGVVVSTNDVISIENALDSLFEVQNATNGLLPYAGRPFPPQAISFTYHLYTLIGVADHFLYTGDMDYLKSLWDKYKFALSFSLSNIDSSGLMNVTAPNDWLRFGMGGHNIEANAILYYTINQGIYLASALNDTANISSWQETADGIKTAANELLWDEQEGMYRDNETTTLMPQDGNAWAVVANLTVNSTQTSMISQNLVSRWTPYGAPAPEAADAISPFISGFELQSHFLAQNTTAALELMRLQWGFMLDDPRMTNSTFIEGYSTTGELHYAPYNNDARISHAHGWATGPTSSLTQYVAGVQLLTAGGATWRIAPSLGDLKFADAGFRTSLGFFGARTQVLDDSIMLDFEAPEGTVGEVRMPVLECAGRVVMSGMEGLSGDVVVEVMAGQGDVVVEGVKGGRWTGTFRCT